MAAESPSLPREVIEEVKTVQRANLSEDEQKQELRMIAHRYQIQEEVIISQLGEQANVIDNVIAKLVGVANLLLVAWEVAEV